MRVEYAKCDACGTKLGEEDRSRDRWLVVRSAFTQREMDICGDCWRKMCDAVGLDLNGPT